ncbi:hypothetical protein BU14_0286s0001 [Porphyra umbilicalis]|uniref:Uncharacterized protein n=1 Tax=Porphyra umbilicalis TaxID=2786 RepID=A0A1X6P0U8_PORUM|nr:hypothetical protein BU14_0286s0001 [Porphyra umbilicalis]|eukprot:OSX74488.1 hypothetical protein BU14_0286s0001 [Porphyra umbilicalis]
MSGRSTSCTDAESPDDAPEQSDSRSESLSLSRQTMGGATGRPVRGARRRCALPPSPPPPSRSSTLPLSLLPTPLRLVPRPAGRRRPLRDENATDAAAADDDGDIKSSLSRRHWQPPRPAHCRGKSHPPWAATRLPIPARRPHRWLPPLRTAPRSWPGPTPTQTGAPPRRDPSTARWAGAAPLTTATITALGVRGGAHGRQTSRRDARVRHCSPRAPPPGLAAPPRPPPPREATNATCCSMTAAGPGRPRDSRTRDRSGGGGNDRTSRRPMHSHHQHWHQWERRGGAGPHATAAR